MWIKFVFEVILMIIFGSLGVLGNCLLVFIFIRTTAKLNFHKLMITLEIYDTIYIILCIFAFAIPETFEDYKKEGYHFYIAPKLVPTLQMALTGSVYSTVGIAIERYLAVCHPFYIAGKNWSAKRYIIPIILFSSIYNAPHYFEFNTVYVGPQYHINTTNTDISSPGSHLKEYGNSTSWDSTTPSNTSLESAPLTYNTHNYINLPRKKRSITYDYKVELTPLRKNKYYYTIYIIGLNFVFNGLVPFSLIIVLNTLLYKELKVIVTDSSYRSRNTSCVLSDQSQTGFREGRRKSSKSKRTHLNEVVLSKITITISIVFIIFHSVKWIPNIYELTQRIYYGDNDIDWPEWIQSITQISHFLIVLNSSVNFYIYYVTHYNMPHAIRRSLQNFSYSNRHPTEMEMVQE